MVRLPRPRRLRSLTNSQSGECSAALNAATRCNAGVPGVTWHAFLLNNLLPATLGNIVAGALCMATVYSLAYGSLGKRVWG